MPKNKLSRTMTVTEFENGYWYAAELKVFGEQLDIPGAKKLRKDELEKAIKNFLRSGKIVSPTKRSLSKSGPKDLEEGLSLDLKITNYTSNRVTKDFILKEAQKQSPGIKKRSGSSYRLNRWREEQITMGVEITYGDLVDQFVVLNESEESFERIPHVRYINFLSDYMASERNATKKAALKAWQQLKKLDIPKDYKSWIRSQKGKR